MASRLGSRGGTATRQKNSERKKLRVAIIGVGNIARYHLAEYAKMKQVELVGLADPVKAKMTRIAEQYKISKEHCFSDYRKMLDRIKPDAVSVCSPNGAHCSNTVAALEAGTHVLVEKPIAMNAKEGRRMLDAAKKNGQKLVIGFQCRFDPRAQFIKKAAEDGQLGKILYGRVQAMRRRGIPNWGVFGQKKLQGGGPLIDLGVHVIEMAHYVMGSPRPVAAMGKTFTYLGDKPSKVTSRWPNWDYKTYTVEDLAVGQVRFDNGAVLTIETSFASHIEKDAWTFQVMGDRGGGQFDPPMVFADEAGHMVNKVPGYLSESGFTDNFGAKMRDFVAHVSEGKPTLCPAVHGLMVQEMIDAVYKSASKGGREVTV